MNGIVVAVAGMGMVFVVVLVGVVLFFAAWAVVVSVFNATGQLFEKQLNEKTHHDRSCNLEVGIGGDKTVRLVAKKDVGDEIDEA